MFTNVSNEEIEERINKDKNSLFLHKEDYLPFELTDKIKEILRN